MFNKEPMKKVQDQEQDKYLATINDEKLHDLFENNHAVMLLIDPETGLIVAGNPAACRFYGYSRAQLRKKYMTEINGLTRTEVFEERERAKKNKKGCFNFRHRIASGEIRDVEDYSGTITIGNTKLFCSIIHDVTDKRKNELEIQEAYSELNQIFDMTSDAMCLIDNDFNVVRANKNYARLSGYSLAEIEGKKCHAIFPSANCNTPSCSLNIIKSGKEIIEYEVERTNQDGGTVYCWTTAKAFRSARGNVIGILGSFKDVTEVRIAEEKIKFMASYDALTELPNRYKFNDFLKKSLEGRRGIEQTLAVVYIDLGRFKNINDTMGHSYGDLILKLASDRLKSCIRKTDTVARSGGDEFLILIDNTTKEDVAKIADQIVKSISQSFTVGDYELFTSPSIGISMYPGDGSDEETLIKNADLAMCLAKQKGRNNYQFYLANLNETSVRQFKLETGLRKALKNKEFVLHYQPQIELKTGKIVGLEALLRWNSPELGMVSPLEFIPLAEESGLIIPIGKWVLENACRQNKIWQDEGSTPIRIAVNISARQFQDGRFVDTVFKVIEETQLDPAYLELEITESFMQNIEELNLILKQLKVLGVGIAVDDFGTGYCSLSILRDLPVDKIKIDQSFIRNMASDQNTSALVKTIITMGHNLNFKVTAEGVEDFTQLSFLKDNKCEFGQGYVFSKPLPADEIKKMLINQRSLF